MGSNTHYYTFCYEMPIIGHLTLKSFSSLIRLFSESSESMSHVLLKSVRGSECFQIMNRKLSNLTFMRSHGVLVGVAHRPSSVGHLRQVDAPEKG